MNKGSGLSFLIFTLFLPTIFLSACSKSNSYGLVFSAIDPKTNSGRIYRYSSSSDSITQVDKNSIFDVYLHEISYVSEDGNAVYVTNFSENRNSATEEKRIALFLSDDGEPFQEIFTLPQGIEDVAFSSDGSRLAVEGTDRSLWLGNVNGSSISGMITVSHLADENFLYPEFVWSPDNKFIAFAQRIDPVSINNYIKSALYSEVYILDVTTLESKKITGYTLGCHFPHWAKNGELIAMHCIGEKDSLPKIIIAAKDGRIVNSIECPKVDGDDSFVSTFALSPDGEKIAYVCEIGTRASLFYSSVDKIEQTNIPIPGLDNIVSITDIIWSSDMDKLIFIATNFPDIEFEPEKDVDQIVIVDLKGAHERIISDQLESYHNLRLFSHY